MKTIDVVRRSPIEIGRCRAPECRQLIEWVITAKHGRRMPVDHPLRAIASIEDFVDQRVVTTIDAGASHFATCPASKQFKRR